ncbi:MAG: glycosyltransferase, partial [Bythopirellula sp.]
WGVADRVVFKSALPYHTMPQVINAFDVGIDLTKVEVMSSGGVQTASFSQKISQYLSCGVPVIAWDTADTRFVADHQLGQVLQHSTAIDVAGALRKLIETRAQNQQRICQYAETHLSADRVARTRLALWQRLVSSDRSAEEDDSVDREQLAEHIAA